MPEGWTITTKEGNILTIDEWLEKKDEKHGFSPEFSKLQEKEVIEQRKCLKKRIGQNEISPEYEEEHSEVRFLTNEEIIKEYKMPVKEGTISERGDTIRELIKFLQKLGGRKVATEVVVQGINRPVKSVSSFLSQLFSAGIVAREPMKNRKKRFIWGIAIPYKNGELEAIISLFNDFMAQRRRKAYLKKKGIISKDIPEETKTGYTEESWNEMVDSAKVDNEVLIDKPKISTPSSNTLRIVVEGNIKILFGLAK